MKKSNLVYILSLTASFIIFLNMRNYFQLTDNYSLLFAPGIIFGMFILFKGSVFFIDGAVGVAKSMRISKLIIGLTLVAFATSLPELCVAVLSVIEGVGTVAIGNIIGANIANICLVLGLAAVIMPLITTKNVYKDSIFMMGTVFILFILTLSDNVLNVYDGLIFVTMYAIYITYLHKRKRGEEIDIERVVKPEKIKTIRISVISIFMGILGLSLGAEVVIGSAVGVAKIFSISKFIIGLTIVSIGTTLPELVTTTTAAIKKEYGIAEGNVIGSCIVNILLILGIASIARPVYISMNSGISIGFLLFLSILTAFMMKKGVIKREYGIFLLIVYPVFLSVMYLL